MNFLKVTASAFGLGTILGTAAPTSDQSSNGEQQAATSGAGVPPAAAAADEGSDDERYRVHTPVHPSLPVHESLWSSLSSVQSLLHIMFNQITTPVPFQQRSAVSIGWLTRVVVARYQ